MPGPSKRLSPSVEDYLKTILALTQTTDPAPTAASTTAPDTAPATASATASTTALAEALGVRPPSVTGMVKRLADQGLLEHTPYRGVQLTEAGRHEALRILRRHRILESYLTERLGYHDHDVHDEAERLEHAVSDRLIEAMADALDDPRHDPHGAPIPRARGEFAEPRAEERADPAHR